MIKKTSKQTVVLFIVLAVTAAFTIYFLYFSETSPPLETVLPEFSVLSPDQQTRLAEVRKIKNISFDLGLLKHPFFKTLRDVEVPLQAQEQAGRQNPFLPF